MRQELVAQSLQEVDQLLKILGPLGVSLFGIRLLGYRWPRRMSTASTTLEPTEMAKRRLEWSLESLGEPWQGL